MGNSSTEEWIKQDGWNLRWVPKCDRSLELCELAIETAHPRLTDSESILHYVPITFRTPKLCWLALYKDGCAIRAIPKEILTYEMCIEAVQRKGDELVSVPREWRDEKMCKIAVEEDGKALISVPEDLLTSELVWLAIRTVPEMLTFAVPEHLITAEMWVFAKRRTQRPGNNLWDIPKHLVGKIEF